MIFTIIIWQLNNKSRQIPDLIHEPEDSNDDDQKIVETLGSNPLSFTNDQMI